MKKKGRGLSYDQKRDKMLKIFHDTKTVFNYDQIEKLSIKAGIPFPTVKDLLNSLKADSLIECEKIGAGVFYWSFPSKAVQIVTMPIIKFESKITYSKQQVDFYRTELEKIDEQTISGQIGREDTIERRECQERFKALCEQQSELKKEIGKYIRFDPQRVQLLKKQNKQLKEAINVQTDNLQQIKKYIKKQQPGTRDAQIQQNYGISADLDYIE